MIVDGYIRVSKVGGRSGAGFIAPTVQREQIDGWAKLHGALVAHVFEELDESGGRMDRPLLLEAIGRIERGESQGLVVAYLSRFGRSLLDGLNAIERITEAGGSFVSVQEGLDFSTDTGRLVLRVLFSIAEWELDRMRSGWMVASERAVARGVFLGSRPPGYRRRGDGGLEVDPVEGPIVTELFRRRAEGARMVELSDFLTQAGLRTGRGNVAWYSSSVRRLINHRSYLGEVRRGAFANGRAHPPLIDEATWERAQLEGQRLPPPRASEGSLLRGIVRCAGCRRLLRCTIRDRGSSREYRLYYCAPIKASTGPCPAPTRVSDSLVEPYVEALFWQELAHPSRRPGQRRLDRLQGEIDRRESELEAYRDNPRLPITLGPERFNKGLAVRVERAERAQAELSRAKPGSGASHLPPASELREQWPTMGLDDRRAAIAEVIECAFLTAGRETDVADRLFVCLRGRAPADLPPDNPRQPLGLRPFDLSACHPGPRLRGQTEEVWSEARLRAELTDFLADRERWPRFAEFQAAGAAHIHAQVEHHGGHPRWAFLMKLRYDPPQWVTRHWTEARVRTELKAYLEGKPDWPSIRAFAAHRKTSLRRALGWYGGPERWAAEMGVKLLPHQRDLQRWTYARIKEDLSRLVGDRSDWPLLSEFEAVGQERLYRAIRTRGIRKRLATELGLRLPPGRRCVGNRWTDPAIKTALDDLVAGRDTWPTRRDFKDAGLGGLYETLNKAGTRDTWAKRYKLPTPRKPRSPQLRGPSIDAR